MGGCGLSIHDPVIDLPEYSVLKPIYVAELVVCFIVVPLNYYTKLYKIE